MAKRKKAKQGKAPWTHPAPADASHHTLTPAKKAAAKRSAKKAGRPYPNLVDNMRAAKSKSTAKRKAKA